jgi:hypothetical protein
MPGSSPAVFRITRSHAPLRSAPALFCLSCPKVTVFIESAGVPAAIHCHRTMI